MKKIVTNNWQETAKIAENILNSIDLTKIKKPIVFLLRGELGGGKTVFSKAIAKVLGVKEIVTSPTFILFNEYRADYGKIKRFLHFDLYRIEDEKELEVIDFWEIIKKAKVVCIEWPENMGEKYLAEFRKKVYVVDVWFKYGKKEMERKIRFSLEN